MKELRDAAVAVATAEPACIPDLVAVLEARGLPIFDRIALHVLRVVSVAPRHLVAAHIVDPRGRRPAIWHEWALLVRERFGDLAADERDRMIELFFTGPDDDRIRARLERIEGRTPTDEEVEARIDFERMRYLQLVVGQLRDGERDRYEVLRAKRGELERPDLLHYSTPLAPPALPDEVRAFGGDIDAWSAFATTYDPRPQLGEDGHEVASRALAAAVQADPTVFAGAASRFAGLRPPYVRAIFSGLDEAARAGKPFAWSEVLALAEWVLAQPVVPQPEQRFEEVGWTYTYHALVWLLRSAFATGVVELPLKERERVWRILARLAENPEPTPEQEAKAGATQFHLQSLALTATRPRTIALAIDYGQWVGRRLPSADEATPPSFAPMPELAALLAEHLDSARDSSLAVRSVYGERLGSLLQLDRAWVEEHRAEIFPGNPEREALRDAAWESYLDGNNVSRLGYDVLRSAYMTASERIGTPARYAWTTPPGVSLLYHLFVLHAVGLDGPDSPLETALVHAPEEIRHGAFELLGRNLRQWAPDSSVAGRLQALVDRRIDAANGALDPAPYAGELATIGLWCDAPPGIDAAWLVRTVARVLTLVGRIDAPHWVTRRVAAAVGRIPGEAVDALDALVTAFRADAWRLDSWMNEVKTIIRAGHATGGAVRERATGVANRLALLGYSGDMRALLAELADETVEASADAAASDLPSG